jgi:transcriptional regulator with XRE-family HTH domain
MPKGMRSTLYFKDDDSRLSFFFGNYVTLTNLTQKEADRICEMHISPINISVHTMNPELRVKMLKNKNAGESLKLIKKFFDAGILMNIQFVLCPGINDGEELRYSLNELAKYGACINSIAAVPVGLTKYREGLEPLKSYTKETAAEVISIIDEFNAHYSFFNNGKILAFASDEFYILAQKELPSEDYYGEYSQLDNGVGMCTLLKSEFLSALADANSKTVERSVSIATGELAFPLLCELSKKAEEKFNYAAEEIVAEVRTIDKIRRSNVRIDPEHFGDTLRRLREAACVSAAALSEELRIKESFIVALEREDYASLPPEVFIIAYIRKLGGVYRLTEDEILALTSKVRERMEVEVPEDMGKVVAIYEPSEENENKMHHIITIFTIVITVVILLIGAGIYFFVSSRSGDENNVKIPKNKTEERFSSETIIKLQPQVKLQPRPLKISK